MNDNPNDAALGKAFAAVTVAAIAEPDPSLPMLAGTVAIGFMATRRRRP